MTKYASVVVLAFICIAAGFWAGVRFGVQHLNSISRAPLQAYEDMRAIQNLRTGKQDGVVAQKEEDIDYQLYLWGKYSSQYSFVPKGILVPEHFGKDALARKAKLLQMVANYRRSNPHPDSQTQIDVVNSLADQHIVDGTAEDNLKDRRQTIDRVVDKYSSGPSG